jgi:DNA polymerase-1
MELPLVEVLADMERAGVKINVPFLADMSRDMEQQIADLTVRIHELAGGPFNINSPIQLRDILFDKLGMKSAKKTAKTRASSTAEEVLEELARHHELPRKILEYRAVQKLKSTYVDALPQLVNPRTGRIHASFNQTVAATGRLSVADPNLQNIPIRTAEGRRIREAFVAETGPPAAERGLQPDRAARARAPFERPDAHRHLPARAKTCTTARRARSSARSPR